MKYKVLLRSGHTILIDAEKSGYNRQGDIEFVDADNNVLATFCRDQFSGKWLTSAAELG